MSTKPKRRRRYIIWGSIILVIVIIRLFLPAIVLHYANKSLANMNGYYGHVNDIDIDLYRGAYQLIVFILIKRIQLQESKQSFSVQGPLTFL